MSPFDVAFAFEPLCRLTTREGTLGGSVPLRVAQACAPLLEGNAFGHQITFTRRLTLGARLGRPIVAATSERDAVDRAHRAAAPVLAARGLVGAWHARLAKSWWWSERGVLRVWTGLVVSPRGGLFLRVSGAGSRAPLGVTVRAQWIAGTSGYVPLILELEGVEDGARLDGDCATIAAVAPTSIDVVDVRAAPELVLAHTRFYDARYFEAKRRGEVTKRYRRMIGRRGGSAPRPAVEGAGEVCRGRVAHVAGPPPEIVRVDRVLVASSTSPVALPREEPAPTFVRFRNAVSFAAHFDGNTLLVEPDHAELERGARAVEVALRGVDPAVVAAEGEHRGALLYLTKYFTPHPRGEPHFFVKPWAFTETAPGWSSLIEGPRGPGYDVMRGVVWTDRFHATPAVFALAPGRRVRVRAGAPLLDVLPVSRALSAASPSMTEVRP